MWLGVAGAVMEITGRLGRVNVIAFLFCIPKITLQGKSVLCGGGPTTKRKRRTLGPGHHDHYERSICTLDNKAL